MDSTVSSKDDVCTCGHRRALHDPDCAFGGKPCQCKAFELGVVVAAYYLKCHCGHIQGEHRSYANGGCWNCRCDSFRLAPQGPACARADGCPHRETADCEYGCRAAADELAQEGQEMAQEAPEDQGTEAPPQPERRPPYAVAYSANGHLYEVLLPGDAWAVAEDGVLKISHGSDPVLGIVRVVPVKMERDAQES